MAPSSVTHWPVWAADGAKVAAPGTRRDRGDQAEALVTQWLCDRGVQIVARNLRLGPLEVDIVIREGPVIAIVEVRARGPTAHTSGFSSVGPRKKLLLRRAGERLWRRWCRDDPRIERLRFDVASVTLSQGGARIEYVRAAF